MLQGLGRAVCQWAQARNDSTLKSNLVERCSMRVQLRVVHAEVRNSAFHVMAVLGACQGAGWQPASDVIHMEIRLEPDFWATSR